MWQQETFSSASSDIANYQPLDIPHDDPSFARGSGAVRVFAQSNSSSGSATLEMALVRAGVVVGRFTATVTPTTRRTAADNSSGDYICDVVFQETSNSKFDLLGARRKSGLMDPGLSGDDSGAAWMVGVTALTTITSLDLTIVSSTET